MPRSLWLALLVLAAGALAGPGGSTAVLATPAVAAPISDASTETLASDPGRIGLTPASDAHSDASNLAKFHGHSDPSWLPVRPVLGAGGRSLGEPGAQLEQASRTLADGAGPARGASLSCAATGSSAARCGPAAESSLPSVATEEWQNASYEDDALGLPPAASGGAMAYDAYDGYVVYFGGGSGVTSFNQTWTFWGSLWHDLTPGLRSSPPAEVWSAMAYDRQYQVVLLYGGCTRQACPNNDTWYFGGASGWTNITLSLSPASPRLLGASAAYASDAADGYTVLYGGCLDASCRVLSNRTYGFSGFGWVEIPTPHAPPATWAQGLAYDPPLAKLVLFGGCGVTTCDGGQTWTYYNFDWVNQTSTFRAAGVTPPGRSLTVLTWDELDGKLLLFGGVNDTVIFGDTWALTCGSGTCTWSNRTPPGAPAPALFGAVAPSESNATIGTLFFGGAFESSSTYVASGPHYFSNGTYFFEPVLSVAPTVPGSAPARSSVNVAAHPSGGSGSYARYAGTYYASWRYNGSDSSGVNATLNFLTPGAYTVQLTAFDRFGVYVARQFTHVATGPSSTIDGGTATDVGLPLTFTAAPATGGNAPYTYLWGFGDGTTGAGASVTYSWGVAGTYALRLYVTDSTGVSFAASETISVGPTLYVEVNASRTTADAGQAVAFSASVPAGATSLSYTWSFGDGSPPSALNSPRHSFPSVGVYPVTLDVLDPAGAHATASATIVVNPALGGVVSVPSPSAIAGEAGTFTVTPAGGTPPYAYAWVFGDGTTGASASLSHTYPSPGAFTLTVWINDSAGANFTRTITVSVESGSTAPDPGASAVLSGLLGGTNLYLFLGAVALALVLVAVGIRRRRGGPTSVDPSEPPRDEDG